MIPIRPRHPSSAAAEPSSAESTTPGLLGPAVDRVRDLLARRAEANLRLLPDGFLHTRRTLEITIVMPSHGRLEQTLRAIRALFRHVIPPFRLLVVDSGSSDQVPEALQRLPAEHESIELLLLGENLGAVGARASALAHVETEYVIFVDNDIEVFPGTVEHLLYALESDRTLVAASGNVVFPNGRIHVCGGDYETRGDMLFYELLGAGRSFDDPAVGSSGRCTWVPTAVTAIRKGIFTRFPYDLAMRHYYEDLEWCYRMNRAGAGSFYRSVEALALHHHESKIPGVAAPLRLRRQRAVEYIETIAHFYDAHGKIIQNLFDFVPELGSPEQGPPVAAGKLLLDLTVAYGREWILDRWERGELGPLFGAVDKADVAALSTQLAEQAAWARRAAQEIGQQSAWARRAAEEVGQRDAIIRDLQARLEQQGAWARRAAEEVGQRDAVTRDLQAQLAQQTDWARRSAEAVAQRDAVIRGLQRREQGRLVRLYRAIRQLATPGRR